jgi:hypothetical protein
MLGTGFLCFVLISAGLAPSGSQLVGYNECSALARSPLGSRHGGKLDNKSMK